MDFFDLEEVIWIVEWCLILVLQACLVDLAVNVLRWQFQGELPGEPRAGNEHAVQQVADLVDGIWSLTVMVWEMRRQHDEVLQAWATNLAQTSANSRMEEGIAAEEGRLERLVEETGDEERVESPSTRASTPLSFSRSIDVVIGNEIVVETDASMDL